MQNTTLGKKFIDGKTFRVPVREPSLLAPKSSSTRGSDPTPASAVTLNLVSPVKIV